MRKRERGAVLLEAAIGLPVLFALIMGLTYLGYAARRGHVMLEAARQGARAAGGTGAVADAAVGCAAAKALLASEFGAVTVRCPGEALAVPPQQYRVEVTPGTLPEGGYNFQAVSVTVSGLSSERLADLAAAVTLTATASFPREFG